jgi:hypothetical protein
MVGGPEAKILVVRTKYLRYGPASLMLIDIKIDRMESNE